MQILTIVVSILTCLGIIITSLIKPSFKIGKVSINFYWIIALIGAIILICCQTIPIQEVWNGLTRNDSINPLKILILFISMSLISMFLDELGFFSYIANLFLKRCKTSQYSVFIIFYLLVSILTMFTSNDIIILTLTPFIIFFCKRSKISPIPYLVSEFIAANTWSMMFIIGNPTNIYIAQSFDITFVDYFIRMTLPTLCAGVLEFGILILLFRKTLKTPMNPEQIEDLKIENKFLTFFGLGVLLSATVLLVISNYINLKMYLISFGSLMFLTLGVLLYYLVIKKKPIVLGSTYKRGPYELIPFVISMFVLVMALNYQGITANIANFFNAGNCPTFIYGYSSLVGANLINNIPMSVLFTDLVSSLSGIDATRAMYASIIGSNIGAFITPIGALAGIMFLSILKKNDIKYRFIDFVKYGVIIGVPTISIALLVIFVM